MTALTRLGGTCALSLRHLGKGSDASECSKAEASETNHHNEECNPEPDYMARTLVFFAPDIFVVEGELREM